MRQNQSGAPAPRTEMKRALTRHAVALVVSAIAGSIALAQQPPQPPPTRPTPQRAAPRAAVAPQRQPGQPKQARARRGPGGPGGPGAQRGPGSGAGMLIALKAQLGLTDEQVKRLEAIREAPHPKPNAADQLRARADMIEATQGDGDLAKARAALDKMSRLRNDEQIARLKERQDIRNVLTAAQKTKLDNMRGMMRNCMKGAMRNQMRDGRRPAMGGDRQNGMRERMQMRMQMRPGMGQGFAPGARRGMGAPGGGMGPGMGPGTGPGMGPGARPGDMGPNGPGQMRPAMGRRGRDMGPDTNIDKRPPVPPIDSLQLR